MQTRSFSKNDVIDYWLRLFPELDRAEDLDKLVKKVSRDSVSCLYKGLGNDHKAERIGSVIDAEPDPDER